MRVIASRLPPRLRGPLRRAHRRQRSLRHSVRERVRPTVVDRAKIQRALREVGIVEGEAVFFQAGMAAFGTIVGGPETVIGAVKDVVTSAGLVVMPAFPAHTAASDFLRADPVIDLRTAKSRVGAVSERFRTSADTHRSIHPTHSLSAWGAGARDLVAGHEDAETPFGPGTPFAKLVERDAKQVWFGTGVGPLTMYHVWECVHPGPMPIVPFLPERFPVRMVAPDGRALEMSSLAHRPELAIGRVDGNGKLAASIQEELLEAGMRRVALGRADVLAVELSTMFERFADMLARGDTIYTAPLQPAGARPS